MDDFLFDILACPLDQGKLEHIKEDNVLYNPRLKIMYQIKEDIPLLLPESGMKVKEDIHQKYISQIESGSNEDG